MLDSLCSTKNSNINHENEAKKVGIFCQTVSVIRTLKKFKICFLM